MTEPAVANDPRTVSDEVWAAKSLATAGKKGHAAAAAFKFQLTSFRNIALGKTRRHLIKDLLPREGLVVVWGAPKCGKSFLVSDIALHIALGRPYRGRRTEQGTVVYITCEGQSGFPARVEAFRRRKMTVGDTAQRFFLLATQIDLARQVKQLIEEVRAQLGEGGCALIVIDTLNRSLVGSESKDEDMSAYIRACDAIRDSFGCAVIVIHHCGTNKERPRGHTSLSAAADAQVQVQKGRNGEITATVELMKDGPEGTEFVSRLEVVELGLDEDGEPVTSCVIEAVDGEPGRSGVGDKSERRLSPSAKIALASLRKAIDEAGQPAPANNHIPATARVVEIDTWRLHHYAGTASDGQKTEARKKAFQRARDTLQAAVAIGVYNDLAWVVADV